MTADVIRALLIQQLPGCEATVDGADGRFSITIITDDFNDLSKVRRQQKVYAAIGEHIKSGAVHAVSIQAFTPSEWCERNT